VTRRTQLARNRAHRHARSIRAARAGYGYLRMREDDRGQYLVILNALGEHRLPPYVQYQRWGSLKRNPVRVLTPYQRDH
jgi:hypothetical protein